MQSGYFFGSDTGLRFWVQKCLLGHQFPGMPRPRLCSANSASSWTIGSRSVLCTSAYCLIYLCTYYKFIVKNFGLKYCGASAAEYRTADGDDQFWIIGGPSAWYPSWTIPDFLILEPPVSDSRGSGPTLCRISDYLFYIPISHIQHMNLWMSMSISVSVSMSTSMPILMSMWTMNMNMIPDIRLLLYRISKVSE
jgi:hypothetical protein